MFDCVCIKKTTVGVKSEGFILLCALVQVGACSHWYVGQDI